LAAPVSNTITGELDSASTTPSSSTRTLRVDPQRVDARVGVAGVDEDLLVFLEPGVQGIPLEPRPSGQFLDYGVVAVDPQRRGPGHVPDLQAVAAGGAAAELLLVLLIDQHRGVDVG
jgi:hypothetical protein